MKSTSLERTDEKIVAGSDSNFSSIRKQFKKNKNRIRYELSRSRFQCSDTSAAPTMIYLGFLEKSGKMVDFHGVNLNLDYVLHEACLLARHIPYFCTIWGPLFVPHACFPSFNWVLSQRPSLAGL